MCIAARVSPFVQVATGHCERPFSDDRKCGASAVVSSRTEIPQSAVGIAKCLLNLRDHAKLSSQRSRWISYSSTRAIPDSVGSPRSTVSLKLNNSKTGYKRYLRVTLITLYGWWSPLLRTDSFDTSHLLCGRWVQNLS